MTTQVPTRFAENELAALDQLVADGVAHSRSEAIRLAVARLHDHHRRARIGEEIAAAYRAMPQTSEELEWALESAADLGAEESW
jgi:Arc/MetJ-type ribon-helix-helix transcriptional regulator